MRSRITILLCAALFAGLLHVTIASAQSGDIIFLDAEPAADAGSADAGASSDAAVASGPDAGADAGEGGIEIVGIRDDLPPEQLELKPRNDRAAILRQLVAHVKRCIATRTVAPGEADTQFLYLIRKDRPHATLTSVEGDTSMHVSRLHVDALRIYGEPRPIYIEGQQEMFRECVEVVPLRERPIVTERVSFHVKAGALKFLVSDVRWLDL